MQKYKTKSHLSSNQDSFCFGRHLEAVVDPSANDPDDLVIGCSEHQAFLLLSGGHLLIDKKVA